MDQTAVTIIVEVVKLLIIATVLMLSFAAMTYIERKALARFTLRYGPNRAGKFGLLQPIADMFKMFFKEEVIPGHVERTVYLLAPGLALVPAILGFAVVPLASQPFVLPFSKAILGYQLVVTPWVADINVGLLFLLGIGSLGTYGVILAGWSSNNKYSLLGGLRTGAQMLSYELPMGVALLSVVLTTALWGTGTLNMNEMVQLQGGFKWFIFLQPLAFIVFFIAALAEAGRSPFDLPETENELVGGFVTEYGGMKFGIFFGAEYIHTVVLSFITATLFLGGWQGPGVDVYPFVGLFYLLAKVGLVIFLILWIRASVPRVRFDKMMRFCWKVLLPLGVINLVITALVIAVLRF
jgi:NADH-quinone oxidoreductase subunit H